jgi:hypothetical protein
MVAQAASRSGVGLTKSGARLHLLLLVLAAMVVAASLLLPYRSVPFQRSDGVWVELPAPHRLKHVSDVWDYLQQARQIQSGAGFSSLFTYVPFLPESMTPEGQPRAAGGGASPRAFPQYWRQPGYPVLLAGAFVLAGGARPDAMLVLQAFFILLLPVATYVLGRTLLAPGWAAMAAIWTLLTPVVLGAHEPLVTTTFFASLVALLLTAVLVARRPLAWFGTGLLLGLTALVRFETWLLVPGLLAAMGSVRRERRVRAAAMILGSALLVVLPWHLRLLALTGDPFYNATSLFFHDTPAFPGWVASRTLAVCSLSPWSFVAAHPGDMAAKTAINLARFLRDFVLLPSPFLAPFLWLAVLRRGPEPLRRGLVAGGVTATLVVIAVLAPMEYAPRFLGPLVPAFAVGAAIGMSRMPRYRALLAGVATMVGVILLAGSLRSRGAEESALLAARGLNTLMSEPDIRSRAEEAVVLSDAPTVYAWIWNRPAVAAPIARDIPGVRALSPDVIALITCAVGVGGFLEADLARDYAEQDGVLSGTGCPSAIVWERGRP